MHNGTEWGEIQSLTHKLRFVPGIICVANAKHTWLVLIVLDLQAEAAIVQVSGRRFPVCVPGERMIFGQRDIVAERLDARMQGGERYGAIRVEHQACGVLVRALQL